MRGQALEREAVRIRKPRPFGHLQSIAKLQSGLGTGVTKTSKTRSLLSVAQKLGGESITEDNSKAM